MVEYKIYNDNNNTHVASIYYSEETKQYTSKLFIPEDTPFIFARFSQEEGKFYYGDRPDCPSDVLEFWLSDRVIPPNRQGIKELLLENGIPEYDWKVLIKLNKGRSVTDYFRVEVVEG